ncbi:11525_t:CDS:2, partial [Funneliformis caledonium]
GKNYSIISVTADFNVARRRFWNTRKYCIDNLLMGAKKKLDQKCRQLTNQARYDLENLLGFLAQYPLKVFGSAGLSFVVGHGFGYIGENKH